MLVVNEADDILSICLVISSENFSIGTNNSRVMSWLHAYECNTTSFISYWRCICSVPSSSSFNGEIFWLLTRCFPQLFCVVKPVKEKFDSHRKKPGLLSLLMLWLFASSIICLAYCMCCPDLPKTLLSFTPLCLTWQLEN